ncbi:YmdB family metallophosphoesterase, partial [Myxococcota bacterium]|nr:YmdB family metallophosphoesterase [Myxococcota bacterium]
MPDSLRSLSDLPVDQPGFRILLLGDVMGLAGVKAVTRLVPELRERWNLDFVVVNGENSNGFGMIPESAGNLLRHGVDVLTGGNHTLRPSAIHSVLANNPRVLRPHNLGGPKTPGRGVGIYENPKGSVAVINLIGQVFMEPSDSPFNAFDTLYDQVKDQVRFVIVDFHAEATGEKVTLARYC